MRFNFVFTFLKMPVDASVSESYLDCSKSASVRLILCLCNDVFVTTCSATYQWEIGRETERLVSVSSYRNLRKRAEIIIKSYHHYHNEAARELDHVLNHFWNSVRPAVCWNAFLCTLVLPVCNFLLVGGFCYSEFSESVLTYLNLPYCLHRKPKGKRAPWRRRNGVILYKKLSST